MRNKPPSKPKLAPAPKIRTTITNESKVKKSNEIGGVTKNWRSKIYTMPGAAASSTASLAKSATSGGEEEPGEFDQDESKTTQAAARLAQAGASSGGRSRGARVKEEDDVKLVPADVAEIDSKERGSVPSARKSYAKRDLPLTSTSQVVNWDKDIVPFIIVWVGTLADTFGANAHPELRDTVSNRWRLIFPKLPSVVEHNGGTIKRHEHPAIFSIFQAIRTWRSEIGKLAVEYMSALWEYELMAEKWNTIQLRREYIEMYLDKNAFAYEDFSPTDGTRSGAFRGALLLQSFMYHVRHLVRVVGKNLADRLDYFEEHGYPIGAMALCFVACFDR
ncbi:hypothetical protein BDZ89DRAFT_189953 [Hymenopellis radicata]|nr:hypothetical protein BDZ89DRAFT_189953 [Hymenopellis radicata]